MKFRLSKLIPVHFSTQYGCEKGGKIWQEHATWWQWRNRIYNHKAVTI